MCGTRRQASAAYEMEKSANTVFFSVMELEKPWRPRWQSHNPEKKDAITRLEIAHMCMYIYIYIPIRPPYG
jgi:hypothetical protein